MQKYLRENLVAPFLKKYPAGTVARFDLENKDDLSEIYRQTGGGLFAKTVLVIINNPAKGEKDFVSFLKTKKEDVFVSIILVSEKKLTKEFSFLGEGKEFEELAGVEFLAYLKAEAKNKGLEATDEKLKSIGRVFEGDLWGAITELEKVANGGEIKQEEVAFDFVGAMSAVTSKGAIGPRLRALMLLLENDDPAKVFNMAGGWAKGEGKVKIADCDVLVKSGKLEFSEALLKYVLE
jgi:DNA polymerase III delta subunit